MPSLFSVYLEAHGCGWSIPPGHSKRIYRYFLEVAITYSTRRLEAPPLSRLLQYLKELKLRSGVWRLTDDDNSRTFRVYWEGTSDKKLSHEFRATYDVLRDYMEQHLTPKKRAESQWYVPLHRDPEPIVLEMHAAVAELERSQVP